MEGGRDSNSGLDLAPAQSAGAMGTLPSFSTMLTARREGIQWLEPQCGPDFLSLRSTKPHGRIAVVAHVYYPELWPELSASISNIEEPFDLFVTLVAGQSDALARTILAERPSAQLVVVENLGRDILPFFSIVRTGVLFRYEFVCKLHTKRSEWHADGETWRKELVSGILGSRRRVRLILSAFRSEPELGMVVADGHMYAGRELWEGNREHLKRFFAYLGMDDTEFRRAFAGGSIFWIRPAVLQLISELPFRSDDFEPEPLGKDGHLVHAIERLISLACYELDMTIRQTKEIMPPELPKGTSL